MTKTIQTMTDNQRIDLIQVLLDSDIHVSDGDSQHGCIEHTLGGVSIQSVIGLQLNSDLRCNVNYRRIEDADRIHQIYIGRIDNVIYRIALTFPEGVDIAQGTARLYDYTENRDAHINRLIAAAVSQQQAADRTLRGTRSHPALSTGA